MFSSPQDAADAYDDAARLYHGEFARTNAQTAPRRTAFSRPPIVCTPQDSVCWREWWQRVKDRGLAASRL
jgi:hypothetical protein